MKCSIEAEHQPNDQDVRSRFLVIFMATRCNSDKILVDNFYELALQKKQSGRYCVHSYKIINEYMYMYIVSSKET